MLLLVLSFLGGVMTIFSPCILPVLPFVFARTHGPFLRNGLPLLIGMALTFALVSTLAAVGGGWAVKANEWGRWIALLVLTLFALTLLIPRLADYLSRPVVALGGRLSQSASSAKSGLGASLLLGVATGLLWAPCAGPILGLILTAAALKGASVGTTLLLLAYALGAAVSLAVVLGAGRRAVALFKPSRSIEAWLRPVLGVAVLVGVAAVALGLDRGVLARLSGPQTTGFEQNLIAKLTPSMVKKHVLPAWAGEPLPVIGQMPELQPGLTWINSPPLTKAELKGKVVLVDFWTYSCINCIRSVPYVEAWAKRYADQGLVVIGVHSPEFAFEKLAPNVRKAVKDFRLTYPVVMDNDLAIWKAFDNNSWPAHYFIDAEGRIRFQQFGEGRYAQQEQVIRTLLAQRNGTLITGKAAQVATAGLQQAADFENALSPETYIGYRRANLFKSPGGFAQDAVKTYSLPTSYGADDWGLAGAWTVSAQRASSEAAGGRIAFKFHARDLHLVMGPSDDGRPVRFRITLDGKPPGVDHGVDANAAGEGVVAEQRLYQLVRQQKVGEPDRLFEIEFLDPGAQAYAFTFG